MDSSTLPFVFGGARRVGPRGEGGCCAEGGKGSGDFGSKRQYARGKEARRECIAVSEGGGLER